jgi:hypothetical protein
MIDLPTWLIEYMKKERCPNPDCKGEMDADFIFACGIRESSKHQQVTVCWIEYFCILCEKSFHMEIRPYSMVELAEDVFRKQHRKDLPKDLSKKVVPPAETIEADGNVCKITDEEVIEAKKIINESESFYQMMISFGITDEDIADYESLGKEIDKKYDKIYPKKSDIEE